MTWKLMPKNIKEARIVKSIVNAFRSASLPSYGSQDNPIPDWGKTVNLKDSRQKKDQSDDTYVLAEENFVHVPWLCKFTFMNGNETHYHVAQFKNEVNDQLINALAHPNGWWRDEAQKRLVLAQNKSVINKLKKMVLSEKSSLGRVHAIWTLKGLDSFDKKTAEIDPNN